MLHGPFLLIPLGLDLALFTFRNLFLCSRGHEHYEREHNLSELYRTLC